MNNPTAETHEHDDNSRRELAEGERVGKAGCAGEASYRELFEKTPDGFFLGEILLDDAGRPRDFRILEANPASERITGLKREEVLGKTAREVLPAIEPYWIETYGEVARTGTPARIESYSKDLGKYFEVTVFSPRPKLFAAVFADVTDRRRVMEALRAANAYNRSLIEANLDPLVTIGPSGKITDVNAAAEAFIGYRRQELLGTDFAAYFTDPGKARAGCRQAFQRGEVRGYGLELRHRDGHATPVSYNATVYRDELGQAAGLLATLRDITKRRREEEELLRLGQRNKVILDAIAEGVVGLDAQGLCIFANPAALGMLGYSADELGGRSAHAMFHHAREDGSPYPEADCPVHGAYKEGRVTRGSNEVFWRKDGSPFFVEFVSAPVWEDGWVVGAVTSFRDVTQRVRAERELQASKAALVEAQRIAHLGNWELDPGRNEVRWSEELYRIFGWSYREAPVPFDSVLEATYAEDRARVTAALDESLRTHRPYDLEHRIVRPDGTIRWVHTRGEVRTEGNGTVTGVVGTALDITERKRVEEALRRASAYARSLIEASPDPLVTIGPNGRISDVNAATEAATGYTRQELIGTDFANYFTDPAKARAGYQKVFREGAVHDYELELLHRDGHTMPVLYNATVYRDDTGRTVGVFAAARDISVRKRVEQELRQLNETLEQRVRERTAQLEELVRELEGISYSVSHDLRSPLRAIDGFAHLLLESQQDVLDAEGKRLLSVIRSNAKRMGRLIDDILDFLRLGRLRMEVTEIDMDEVARDVVKELEPVIGERVVHIEVKPMPSAPGDRASVRKVLANLLNNAIKFTRAREAARIEIGGETHGKEHVYYVKDNGVGFDMQYVGKLFGVFQRLHGMEEFEGTGIGLAIVKRIVERHGGRVWAEGNVGEGATFYFALPVKAAAPA